MALRTNRYLQNLNIPAPDIKSFSIKSFNGGFNNVSEPRDNQAHNMLNMSFSESNLMEKRTGLTVFRNFDSDTLTDSDDNVLIDFNDDFLIPVSPVVLPEVPVTFIDEFKPYSGINKPVIATNSKVYIDGLEVASVSGRIRGTTYMGEYWFVDGTDIFIYDGTSAKKLKSPPPGFTPAPAPATIGVWKNDATHRWYEPCAAEINDEYKGANVIPVGPKYICARKERLYMAGCSNDIDNVFISDVQNGFYFPVTLPIQYNPNGEKITGLKEFMDVVIVGRDESIWAIYGNTNRLDSDDLFVAKQVASHSGIFAQESMQLMHNYMVFLGNDGVIYRMTTPNSDVKMLTTAVLSVDIDIEKFPFFYDPKDMNNICAIFYNGEYMIRINNHVFVYNYRYLAWTVYDSLDANYFFNYNGTLVIGDSKGRLLRFKNYFAYIDETSLPEIVLESQHAYSDYDDEEMKSIEAFWKTRRIDMGIPSYYKFFRDIFVVSQTYRTINAFVDMLFEVDYDDVESSFRINNRVSIFGVSQFGDRFISKDITQSIPTRIGRRGRYLSITVRNNDIDGPLKIHEISVDFTIRGRR